MSNINFEFRKGIFFIRFIYEIKEESNNEELKKIILENRFKYVVLNTNYVKKINLYGLNYLMNLIYIVNATDSNVVICDKSKIINKLTNYSIPNITDEIEVL